MFKKLLLTLALVMMFIGLAYAKNVSVSNVSIDNVNPGAGTCSITYDLSRTDGPTIDADQPIWVLVKYRLSTDTDYTGWQDTDDHTTSNDASDDNDDSRADSVNANLTGDVGIVELEGSKTITWNWGGTGTGLSSTDQVRVRVYTIEMVKVGGGNYQFKDDTSAYARLTGTTSHSGSDYHLQKYPVTNKMYADFLNACANRHDPGADGNHDFWNSNMDDNAYGGIHITGMMPDSGTGECTFAPENGHDDWPVVYADWYNAYDYCAWAGLDLPEEEHWYKVAGESEGTSAAVSDWYWGNTAPNCNLCNCYSGTAYCVGHASDVNDYESNVDGTDGGNVYKAYELTGNVWEWTDTLWYFDGYTVATPYDGTKGPTVYTNSSSSRVIRGGPWASASNWVRAASRNGTVPRDRTYNIGIRAVRLP